MTELEDIAGETPGGGRRLKVLIGCRDRNKYIGQLTAAVRRHPAVATVVDGMDAFWHADERFDIVHLQWPESLFNWEVPDSHQVDRLGKRLAWWSERTSLVATIHNYRPHLQPGHTEFYRVLYHHMDGFVHLGEASRCYLVETYPFAKTRNHAVIPHGDYSCFPNVVSREEARTRFDIGDGKKVVLSIGNVRHQHELDVLHKAFLRLTSEELVLIVAGQLPDKVRLRARYWRMRLDQRIRIDDGWIDSQDIQYFLNAADVVVISRKGVLNSGNVALGFTFGRVVVGPDEGVVGEVLRARGNPVFDPGSSDSMASAIQTALDLDEDVAYGNGRFAREHMNWKLVSDKHVALYSTLIQESAR